ncbi:hypothetical protein JMJ55_04800 [Belnapia sp. T6]|uniref:Uncharacterized protein n=1 Tax=Belnapia mucosa TaxID=2804532 RepID=A0ABS1UYV9_9PROT|nr:hypothetical protein [Belnapia mucosa]MBL6454631.1 hypothetical protein [Belnapia mucosa]
MPCLPPLDRKLHYRVGFSQTESMRFEAQELFAIAATVVGGTLAGVLLLGLIFNILNFENGRGTISLSVYWQSVIRGLFLLVVVLLQARLLATRTAPAR